MTDTDNKMKIFANDAQRKIFIDISKWLKANSADLEFLDPDKFEAFRKMLDNMRSAPLAELSVIKDVWTRLKRELDDKRSELFQQAAREMAALRTKLFNIPNYDNMPDVFKEEALNLFSQADNQLASATRIGQLQAILDNFREEIFPRLVRNLEDTQWQPINPTGGGENSKTGEVAITDIIAAINTGSLSNTDELEGWLVEIANVAKNELASGKIIILK